jgi:hypothetical protein
MKYNKGIQPKRITMKLGKLAEFYYTAAEARKKLGLDESTFQYWGKEERVNRIYLPGRKQPVYSKREIDDLVNEIEATVIAEKAKEAEFRKATVKDIEEENRLAQLVFGRAASAMPRKLYLENNPEGDYHLYDQGKLVAYITIFPLKKETISAFMQGEIRGWQITPNAIEQLIPGKSIELLLMDMVTTPTVPPQKRKRYGQLMIANLLKILQSWGEKGIEFTKFYAIAGTPDGQRILESAKFTRGEKSGAGRISYELDINNSDAKWLRGYKDALENWKKAQQKLTTKNNTFQTTT